MLSWSALVARSAGNRAILMIGAFASAIAFIFFALELVYPSTTTAAHDFILKTRWSSPVPSSQVVIVDIDEKSLAALAKEHGRWPWPRMVLADGLQIIHDAGASAILFNIVLSDPDKYNPESDSAMEATVEIINNVAYPLIRLNRENDSVSEFRVRDLHAITGDRGYIGDETVAVILPMFEPMLKRLGVSNHLPDPDGIIRRYPLTWTDPLLVMPSIVSRTADIAGVAIPSNLDAIALNWRNKRGRYYRVSFSDLLSDKPENLRHRLDKALVVVGVSAPGLGQTKATAVLGVDDDNEILATALDDLLNRSYLRILSPWVILFFELFAVWVLVWLSINWRVSPAVDVAFWALESGSVALTLISASYTNLIIDLSTVMVFSAGVFGVIRVVRYLDTSWSRATPGYRKVEGVGSVGSAVLIGYRDSEVGVADAQALQTRLESQVGLNGVIRVDDLFGGGSFLNNLCKDYSCQITRANVASLGAIQEIIRENPIRDKLSVQIFDLDCEWNPESDKFRHLLAPVLIRQFASIIERDGVRKV